MPDDVRDALEALVRIRQRGARKRQLGYLAKRLRLIDLAPIEAALEEMRQAARSNTADHHRIEMWRDRLLGDGPGEKPQAALTAFLEEHDVADRQALRQLQRSALTERAADKPPAAARQLFRLVRDTIAAERTGESVDGFKEGIEGDAGLGESGESGESVESVESVESGGSGVSSDTGDSSESGNSGQSGPDGPQASDVDQGENDT